MAPSAGHARNPRVGLFVTCLVDFFRPSVAFAAVKLLESGGVTVDVPDAQTCCGQPAYNSGDLETARSIARSLVGLFEPYDYVVAPSGSCAAMIARHVPGLLADDSRFAVRAAALAERTYELVAFLAGVLKVSTVPGTYTGNVVYHDSCSSLRELGIRTQPRALLAKVKGVSLKHLAESEACCGFGGLFCVKYGDISTRIADQKLDRVIESGADTLVAADLGCLLHLAGRLMRRKESIRVRHVAEVLAGITDEPAIGDPESPHDTPT
jgi:L-lactate dehydrogenase complex protein LldE